VIADREKLSAVFENLVINAIKFTPEGGRILVSAKRAPLVPGARPAAEISVVDTGIGIPNDQLARIFNRFHQVDSSTTRRFGGVGLGLAIVKSILEAHGAGIQVESQEGKGTAFRFQLPTVEKVEAPAPTPARAVERAEEGLVLVVDDDPEVVRLVRGYLEDEGLAVLSASTAAEGAAVAADRHPDVILLDLLLPDQSGLELLQKLKRDPSTARIPVLVVSIMNDTVKGLTMGAADYLVKPVERAAMVAAVRRLLDGGAREPTVLVVDDEHDTAELIRDTLRTEGLRTQVAHHGRQALELIARKKPDLVILDIMMPEMSGFEVLEALGRDQGTAGIPVLVLTARGDENDARRGLELGARRYMSKPFDVRALIAEVRRHLRPQGQENHRRASL
jgi:DNA-binding response OmpR family regulator